MRERDTVVVTDRGSGMGMILGIIAIIAIVAAIWFFALGPGSNSKPATNGGDTNINVTLPSLPAANPS